MSFACPRKVCHGCGREGHVLRECVQSRLQGQGGRLYNRGQGTPTPPYQVDLRGGPKGRRQTEGALGKLRVFPQASPKALQ